MAPVDPHPSGRRRLLRIMAGVFATALAVRLLYLVAFRFSPFFSQLLVDAQWHDEWAWNLARGTWDPEGMAFFRAPLYPFWLSLCYRVLGHDLMAVRLVQAVVGAGTAAALGGAGVLLAGRAAGWIAGIAAALYGPLVYFDGELLIPNLFLALLSWSLFLLAGRASRTRAGWAAILLGLAAIARPNALVLIPALAFLIRRRHGGWRLPALAVLLALAPALAVTGVNTAREGTVVLVASQGGVNFFAGNNALASGRSVEIAELADILSWRQFVEESRKVAEAAEGRPLNSREVSAWWRSRAWRWMREHPVDALGLAGRKAYYLVNAHEIPSNRDPYFRRPGILNVLLWKSGWFAFPWGLLFPMAVVGWVAAGNREDAWRGLLAAWIVLYGLTVILFFVNARFRLGLLPPLFLLAGFAGAYWREALRPLPVLAGLFALVLVNTAFFDVRRENPAQQLARLGNALNREGRFEEGLAALEEARALDPGNLPLANLLAEGLLRAGRFEDALPLYNEVLAGRPDDPTVWFNVGTVLLALERYDDATNALRVAIELRADDAASWVNLGVALEGRLMRPEAERAYRQGLRLAPDEVLPYLRLGALLGPQGGGIEVLEAGARRIPDSFELRYTLASWYRDAGRIDRALAAIRAAIRVRPEHAGARKLERELELEAAR